jgi:general secretion pathway protein N
MNRIGYIVLGAIVFLLCLVALTPATVAYRWLAPDSVRMTGVNGTIWAGNARLGSVEVFGFQDLKWDLKPTRLLLGKLAAQVSMKLGEGFLEGDVASGLTGRSFSATDLKGSCSLANFKDALPIDGIDGILNLDLKSLAVSDGIPTAAEGMIRIGRLSVAMAGSDVLGDYQVNFDDSLPDEGIAGRIKDLGTGPFEVAGSLIVKTDGNFSLEGTVKARPSAPAHLKGMLTYLGSEAPDGSHSFELSGSL